MDSLEKISGCWYISRTCSYRVKTQYPCACVLKNAGLASRNSLAFCQWLPTSSGGDASRWMTGHPPVTRTGTSLWSPSAVLVITASLPRSVIPRGLSGVEAIFHGERCPESALSTHLKPGGLRGRRSGHPCHRTLCDHRRFVASPSRACPSPTTDRVHTEDHRRRVDHPGGDPGAEGLHQRGPVPALCPQTPDRHVPQAAPAVGLQQATTQAGRDDVLADRHPGRPDQHRQRRRVAGRLLTCRMRTVSGDPEAL